MTKLILNSFYGSIKSKDFVWNYRGEASKIFQRVCKKYVKECQLDAFIVLETRMGPGRLSKKIKALKFDGYEYTHVKG